MPECEYLGSNYLVTFLPSSFAITPRPLTILPTPGQEAFAGSPAASPFSFTFTGVLAPGDTPGSVFSGNLGYAGSGTGTFPFTLGTLALFSNPNYTYNLSPDAPFLTVLSARGDRRAVDGLEIFNSTRGRNNEDEDQYINPLDFPLNTGHFYYAPASHQGGLMHVSSHDLFGPGESAP
ncbi:MAG: hypothetical protein ACAI35_26220 [Candidatus Methylacidiphilales bacterium]|nr:hypothetical protein [Candidatus Methylacidiphilales bacterium]